MNVKEESEEAGLNLNIQKTKIIACGPITSWQIDGETVETVSDFIFWVDEVYWPAVTREQSPAFLRNSNGRLDFPGPTQEAC